MFKRYLRCAIRAKYIYYLSRRALKSTYWILVNKHLPHWINLKIQNSRTAKSSAAYIETPDCKSKIYPKNTKNFSEKINFKTLVKKYLLNPSFQIGKFNILK